jgi:hypothetical protein
MTLFSLKTFLLSLLATAGISIAAADERTILWPDGGRLREADEIKADYGCKLQMYGDGNFVVRRRIQGMDSDRNQFRTSWSTGVQPEEAVYALELANDGNLEVINEDRNKVVWTTNLEGDTTNKSHELVIDGACRIKLQWDGEDVWENIKTIPFKAGQVLQRGDIFRMKVNFTPIEFVIAHPFSLHYILALQNDCNLVQSTGTDYANPGSVVWTSGTTRLDGADCYMYLDKGSVSLYKGTFDSSLGFGDVRPHQIWSTPPGWLDESDNSDQIQEGYELVLNSDGTGFRWFYSEDEDEDEDEDGDDCGGTDRKVRRC